MVQEGIQLVPSVYVSIPSMRDSEYFNTVTSCYEQSSGKNEIHIGTAYSVLFNNRKVIKDIEEKLPKIPNLNIKFINLNKNRGVGYGRLESMSFYNNQDYFLQCDSHTLFLKDWDQILIDGIYEAKNFYSMNKIYLTGYARPYYFSSENQRAVTYNTTSPIYPFYICPEDPNFSETQTWRNFANPFFNAYNSIPKWITTSSIEEEHFLQNRFELCTKANANFLFAEKELAKDYNKLFPWPFFFFEEEFIMTIEAFKIGWTPVFPNFDINICHLYGNDFNEFYPGRETIEMTDRDSDIARNRIFNYLEENKDIIEKYFKYSSVDKETRMSTKVKYIPKVEDLFCGN